jgi:hypothetical protein
VRRALGGVLALLSLAATLSFASCGEDKQQQSVDRSAARATCYATGVAYGTWWADSRDQPYGLRPSHDAVARRVLRATKKCERLNRSAAAATCYAASVTFATWLVGSRNRLPGLSPSEEAVARKLQGIPEACAHVSVAKATCTAASVAYATWWADSRNRPYGLSPSEGAVAGRVQGISENCMQHSRHG